MTEPATDGAHGDPRSPTMTPTKGWLWGHIGRISGIVLGVMALGVIVFLAAIGFSPAFGVLMFLLIGTALIFVGGRIKHS
jgi:hypothetical protein